jgi:hypothetical protein
MFSLRKCKHCRSREGNVDSAGEMEGNIQQKEVPEDDRCLSLFPY